MKVGFYAGSFDPFTTGHLHIVRTASQLFDRVIIGIGVNPKKTRRYNKDLLLDAIKQTLTNEKLNNVECIIYEGLTVDAATQSGANFLIRGIRNGMDYDFEENLAQVNQEISGIDTVYVRAGAFGAVSSSMVSELTATGHDVSKYLPEPILKLVRQNKYLISTH